MWSIALFPCSYTGGAKIIGELSYLLNLQMYTDEILFSGVSGEFGVPVEKVTEIICEKAPSLHRYSLRKEKYVNLLRCSLEAQMLASPGRRLHYGLHTSLLDSERDRVMKILVFDPEESRVRRAIQQEGFSEKAARDHIMAHDGKVTEWTQFIFQKDAYDTSLYDVVIRCEGKDLFDITNLVMQHCQEVDGWRAALQGQIYPKSAPENHCSR